MIDRYVEFNEMLMARLAPQEHPELMIARCQDMENHLKTHIVPYLRSVKDRVRQELLRQAQDSRSGFGPAELEAAEEILAEAEHKLAKLDCQEHLYPQEVSK